MAAGEKKTRLLLEWKSSSKKAMDLLVPLVYGAKRRTAQGYPRDQRAAATLPPNPLGHEAILRMAAQGTEQAGMTPERWRRVGELFHESFDVPAAERTPWIDRVFAADPVVGQELVSLLESDRAAAQGLMQERLKSAVISFCEETAAAERPERVGPYRLVRELGPGGIGTGYLV